MAEKIIVKSNIGDLLAFTRLVKTRRNKIKSASPEKMKENSMDRLVREMHPEKMFLKVSGVKQETESTRSFTLVADTEKGTHKLARFRAGQYLNLVLNIGDVVVSRNYSLSSTPSEADEGFYTITVRKKEGGFVTDYIFDTWKEGSLLESSGPAGNFVYERLRDKKEVVAIAGGCGITPIYSIVQDELLKNDVSGFTIIYGVRNSEDIIFKKKLDELAEKHGDRVSVYYVASEPEAGWTGPKGFITAALIRELAGDVKPDKSGSGGKSLFLCGPQAMYRFLDGEVEKLGIPGRQVRRELFGEAEDPLGLPGFPADNIVKNYTLAVHMADEVLEIQAAGSETVLVSLERAGLAPPSNCRSGECGWCRSKLISGEIFVPDDNDGRRIADRKFGWFHPCSSYPVSDLEIRVPRSL